MASPKPTFHLRRLLADAVNAALGLGLALVLAKTAVGDFFATRAVVMLHIGAPDTIWKGPIPMMMGIFGPLVYGIPFAMLLIRMCEPVFGSSPGLALARLKIVSSTGATPPPLQRWQRALVAATPWWGLVLALLAGSWVLAIVFASAGILLFINVVLSAITPLPRIFDIVSRTTVLPTL